MNNLPQSRQSDIVVQELVKETLIYDLKINKAFRFNETSALVWQLCDGQHSVEQISQGLSRQLNFTVSDEFVWLALDQFKRNGLLENNNVFEINFNGLSRRQIIRKVGLASMIVLPTISSLVAPTSATAASINNAPPSNPPNVCNGLLPSGSPTLWHCNFLIEDPPIPSPILANGCNIITCSESYVRSLCCSGKAHAEYEPIPGLNRYTCVCD